MKDKICAVVCCITMILLSYSSAAEALTTDNKNRQLTKYELQIINDALLEYQALHKGKALPKDLIDLFRSPALIAEESIDNRDHVFIEKYFFMNDAGMGNVLGMLIPPLNKNTKINIVKNNQVIDLWEQPICYKVNPGRTGFKNNILYRQAGNSIPVPIFEEIFLAMRRQKMI